MPCEITHITTLVELWSRRHAPVSADLQRALHLARRCCDDAESPIWMRSLCWHLVSESHRTAGWEIPRTENLSACRAAAASVSHGYSLLKEEMTNQIKNVNGPVMILGALGAVRSILGKWDAVPTTGAILIPLDREENDLPSATDFNLQKGVIWAGPGRHRNLIQNSSKEVDLDGRPVLLPNPEFVVAKTRSKDIEPGSIGSMIFCAAALETITTNRWAQSEEASRSMDAQVSPTEMALRLGIADWLNLKIPAVKKMKIALRRAFRRTA